MTQKDKTIVRDLAKRYMELALSEEQQRMNRRMKDTNDLKITRPTVLLDEIPWYQMNIDDALTCQCEDSGARHAEYGLRTLLYRRKYFKADTLFEPFWRVTRSIDSTGIGLSRDEDIVRTDDCNNIVSHAFRDVLEDEDALEKMHMPEFTLRPDKDERNMNYYTDLLGDAMPVKLAGCGCFYFAPWDDIAFLRGVEPILIDMYDRPEYLHRIIRKFIDAASARLDFIEQHSHVDPTQPNLHCTPAYVNGLAEDGWKATWYRGMAQMFSSVSPEMHKEFEIDYIMPLAERFAHTYYGCCEPLDDKFDVITALPNLRKIGVSPWANEEILAERISGNYVYARKPNPANVAIHTDPDHIRRETETTVKLCQKYGCPVEFVLKDISTVSHRPENLITWANTVSDVLDEYYGEA
ncbi:MAG: hypothetical protein IJX93_00800 [Clostridia bacterium]|nr:hypothetical protein [Clostridia bacterium]